MSATQFRTTQLPNYIILILYIITGSLGNLGAIDILAPQWIYLGAVNILACLYLFFNTESAQFGLSKLSKSIFIYVYLFYFIWSGLSYFYAINPTETLINLPRLGNTFFAIFFCFLFLHGLENKIVFISTKIDNITPNSLKTPKLMIDSINESIKKIGANIDLCYLHQK